MGVSATRRWPDLVRAGGQFRSEAEKESNREADHVGHIALDSVDQRRAESLHRIPPSPAAPFAAGEIAVDQLLVELREGHPAGLDAGSDGGLAVFTIRSDQRERSEDLVGPSGERLEAPARL